MAMFPDSGVPPSDAKNSLPDVTTTNQADELWYSTSRCQPRFDPAAANAMLSEDMNLIMKGEVTYDGLRLDNLERATRYLIQRGLPRSALMTGGPNAYLASLDPAATRYSDYMTLTVVPAEDNANGGVTLNLNNLGVRSIVRSDGLALQRDDLVAGVPFLITYYGNKWWRVGLANSQVPLVRPSLLCWIRTDGNDNNDGTANDPAHAFRTIAGCWAAVGSRYAATPMFSINMMLGIPGTYEGCRLGPFGGVVSLTGDADNRSAYRISSFYVGGQDQWVNFQLNSLNLIIFKGVTFQYDQAPPHAPGCVGSNGSAVSIGDCQFDVMFSNTTGPGGYLIGCGSGGRIVGGSGRNIINGNNLEINGFYFGQQGNFYASGGYPGNIWEFNNVKCSPAGSFQAYHALSVGSWAWTTINETNVTGAKYTVGGNSVLMGYGLTMPGTLPGVVGDGGRFIA